MINFLCQTVLWISFDLIGFNYLVTWIKYKIGRNLHMYIRAFRDEIKRKKKVMIIIIVVWKKKNCITCVLIVFTIFIQLVITHIHYTSHLHKSSISYDNQIALDYLVLATTIFSFYKLYSCHTCLKLHVKSRLLNEMAWPFIFETDSMIKISVVFIVVFFNFRKLRYIFLWKYERIH